MPNDLTSTPYSIAHKARNPLKRSPVLPPSKGESVKPEFLLGHENHFDKSTVTPEQLMQKGILKGKPDPVETA
jgi:hypothetical protein